MPKPFAPAERVETQTDAVVRHGADWFDALMSDYRKRVVDIATTTRPKPTRMKEIRALTKRLPQVVARAMARHLERAARLAAERTRAALLPHARRSPRLKRHRLESTGLPGSSPDKPRLTAEEVLIPIDEDEIYAIVYGEGWDAWLATLTRLAPPDLIAAVMSDGLSDGLNVDELARLLLPTVAGVRASAMRVARTEALRVSHESQMAVYSQLGDLVVGYQIHATLDKHTRPEHKARDGTRYYARPVGSQLGYDEMPRPPLEADGTVAFNCRCFLTPILDLGD